MPEPDTLLQYIYRTCACEKDMTGMKVLITAGPTQEAIDPVRYITNHSSGKMGYNLARACMLRGADVTLVTGKTSLTPPLFVETIPVVTACDMYEAVTERSADMDLIIKAAAVADYRPAIVASEKTKKADGQLSIELERTDDILAWVGAHKPETLFVCGFSMETRDLVENSTAKLNKKNMDMIVANNLKVPGAGFGVDTNVVTIITHEGAEQLPLQSKDDVAMAIVDHFA